MISWYVAHVFIIIIIIIILWNPKVQHRTQVPATGPSPIQYVPSITLAVIKL